MQLAEKREQVFTLLLALADVKLVAGLVILVGLSTPRYFLFCTWLGDV